MNCTSRTVRWVILSCTVLTSAILLLACDPEGAEFASQINGEWTTTGADGERETVDFQQEQIQWRNKAQGEYSCPYRVRSFSEKARTVDISTICQKRSGSTLPTAYQLKLSEDGQSLSILLEGRTLGVYRSE